MLQTNKIINVKVQPNDKMDELITKILSALKKHKPENTTYYKTKRLTKILVSPLP